MEKLTGIKPDVFFGIIDPAKTLCGNDVITAAPETWYCIAGRGDPSGIPDGFITGSIFRSPVQGSPQIVLRTGDRVIPAGLRRFTETGGGSRLSMPFSGSFRDNADTGEFTDITVEFLSRYFSLAGDSGDGCYQILPAEEKNMVLMLRFAFGADQDRTDEQWLLIPAVLPAQEIMLYQTAKTA